MKKLERYIPEFDCNEKLSYHVDIWGNAPNTCCLSKDVDQLEKALDDSYERESNYTQKIASLEKRLIQTQAELQGYIDAYGQ